MSRKVPNRIVAALALTGVAGALAAVAFAAQPKSDGSFGGTFANGKNYVSFYAQKKKRRITLANVQYVCKGKGVLASITTKFKPATISPDGSFVIKFKSRIIRNEGKQTKVASGRVRIVGRFVSGTRAKGTARVKSRKCPKRKQRFTVRGPHVEG
jgi:hypothetical protein